jgi:hypothetical protein
MGTPTICFFGYAFVNGTDMIQMLDFNNTSEELWEELQKVEAAISSTCEAIISEERHLCLVDFPWQGVKWWYKRTNECPGSLHTLDIQGIRKELTRILVDKAAKTLGIHLADNGDTSRQAIQMESKAKE